MKKNSLRDLQENIQQTNINVRRVSKKKKKKPERIFKKIMGLPRGSVVKNSPTSAGGMDSVLDRGKSRTPLRLCATTVNLYSRA